MVKYYDEDINKYLDDELGKVSLTKKGQPRKRRPKEPRIYFTQDTENAILEYLSTTDTDKRNKIYNERIAYSFYKLSENIIHTFEFYHTDTDTIKELIHEVTSVLLEKLHLYKQEKGKAYSYFGTIVKRYLIVYNDKNYKKLQQHAEIEEIDEDSDIMYDTIRESEEEANPNTFFSQYVQYIDKYLYQLFPKNTDAKTADAIMELFRKCEMLDVFNKKALYIYIREMTNVSTPQITKITKKLKELYCKLYNEYYEHGFIKI
jgi:hypothetical protein